LPPGPQCVELESTLAGILDHRWQGLDRVPYACVKLDDRARPQLIGDSAHKLFDARTLVVVWIDHRLPEALARTHDNDVFRAVRSVERAIRAESGKGFLATREIRGRFVVGPSMDFQCVALTHGALDLRPKVLQAGTYAKERGRRPFATKDVQELVVEARGRIVVKGQVDRPRRPGGGHARSHRINHVRAAQNA
jgi:hypothetical protein